MDPLVGRAISACTLQRRWTLQSVAEECRLPESRLRAAIQRLVAVEF